MKKFKSDPSIPDGEVALADDNIYIVEAVERHRLRSKGKKRQTKSNYEFLVKFEGFDVSEWQAYTKSLELTTAFQDYVKTKRIAIFTK